MNSNPFENRLAELEKKSAEQQLDAVMVYNQANVRSLTGIDCDNACFVLSAGKRIFYTDFRYVPMVHRLAPELEVRDIGKLLEEDFLKAAARIGYESSMPHSRYLKLAEAFAAAEFVDLAETLLLLRAVKTPEEIEKLRASEAMTDRIWSEATPKFRAGMTEREMANVIRHLMIDLGDGEAFETIVCVGANAAECHHVPDDTKWDGVSPVLVDMGVKLNGYCSDMTRNHIPTEPSARYQSVYNHVLKANTLAIAAAKPGMTCEELDAVARDYLKSVGFEKEFGHSLGHGVGIEIHESPAVARKQQTVLKPGMLVTIEPGVYLEGELGVRIEDLILITETGCEVLSHSAK